MQIQGSQLILNQLQYVWCVWVCVCVFYAVSHPSKPTKRFHTLAAITNLLLFSHFVRLSLSLSIRFYLVDLSAAFEHWECGCVGILNVNILVCTEGSSSRITHAYSGLPGSLEKQKICCHGQLTVLCFIFSTHTEPHTHTCIKTAYWQHVQSKWSQKNLEFAADSIKE